MFYELTKLRIVLGLTVESDVAEVVKTFVGWLLTETLDEFC